MQTKKRFKTFSKSWQVALIGALLHAYGTLAIAAPYDVQRDERGITREMYLPLLEALGDQGVSGVTLPPQSGSQVYRIPSVPMLLTPQAMNTLQVGADQRARAIVAFLKDYYSGKNRFAKAGQISMDLLREVERRQNVDRNHVDPARFQFVYGPDVMRIDDGTEDGKFLVLEENPTCAAGINRTHDNVKQYLDHYPQVRDHVEVVPTFLEQIVDELARQADGGKTVFLQYGVPKFLGRLSAKARNYLDNQRSWDVLAKKLGFEIVRVAPWGQNGTWSAGESWNSVELNQAGEAVLVKRNAFGKKISAERIGSVFVDVLTIHLGKWAAPKLLQAWKNKRLFLSHTPGVELFDDKALNPYVEKMVRFFLHEEPIMRAPLTQSFGNEDGSPNEALISEIRTKLSQYVIKKVSGEGGEFVYVGMELLDQPEKLNTILETIRKDPKSYLAQEYLESAVFDNYLVDKRPHVMVSKDNEMVRSGLPFSRGVLRGSGFKHNVTGNVGSSIQPVVFVSKENANALCRQLFAAP